MNGGRGPAWVWGACGGKAPGLHRRGLRRDPRLRVGATEAPTASQARAVPGLPRCSPVPLPASRRPDLRLASWTRVVSRPRLGPEWLGRTGSRDSGRVAVRGRALKTLGRGRGWPFLSYVRSSGGRSEPSSGLTCGGGEHEAPWPRCIHPAPSREAGAGGGLDPPGSGPAGPPLGRRLRPG